MGKAKRYDYFDPARSALPPLISSPTESTQEWLDKCDRFGPRKTTNTRNAKAIKWADVGKEPTCALCGGDVFSEDPSSRGFSTVDHIIPRSKGGSDARENLQRAHKGCNSDKSNNLERQDLERLIVGALRSNVAAHGTTVEGSWIGSAAKRIAGQLQAPDWSLVQESLQDN